VTEKVDVIVVGVGTGGEDVSLQLLDAGLSVVGIEPRLIGGECPYWACLPTKFLVRNANLIQEARRADGLVGKVTVEPSWELVSERLRAQVTGAWDNTYAKPRFESRGGRVVDGWARLVGPDSVEVNGETIVADRAIVLATGSMPAIPPIPGLDAIDYWTTHDAIAAKVLPASLTILGGGAVGCELGQVFSRFGVEVTIVEAADHLLPTEEPEASSLVEEALMAEGVTLRRGVRATAVASDGISVGVELSDGTTARSERLLIATGRHVDTTGLHLDAAGVTTTNGFIDIDDHMRATEGIWAIGDVTGKSLFTHVAMYQALIAVEDILGLEPAPADYRTIPRATFTDPEVGSVGITESMARATGIDVDVVVKQVPATFRGWLHQTGNVGLIKLVADREHGVLVGATAVGPNGAEVLGMLASAVHHQVRAADLARMIYAFPTFWGGVGEALGAGGRGATTVLDPDTAPLVARVARAPR